MPAAEVNITLEKGADYEAVGYITDDFDNPLDISGDTFRAQVRGYCGGPILASFTFVVFLDTTVTPNIYKFRQTMPQSTINAITQQDAVWDLFQESPAGKSNKPAYGKVKITCNVTSPTI